ncbi:MAG: PDZ domain-containing protein, partial [Bacteroidota bacterium]
FNFLFGQNHQSTAYLGIYGNKISKSKARKLNFENTTGTYLTSVIPNTAAAQSGFQPFDYIYKIDDREMESHQPIRALLANYQPGDKAMVYFIRNGEPMQTEVELGVRDGSKRKHRDESEDPFLGVSASHGRVPEGVNGVRVDILDNSTAEEIGLQDDDIITNVNGYPTLDWHDLGAAIDAMEVGEEIAVTYRRDDQVVTATGPIKSEEETEEWHSNEGKNSGQASDNEEQASDEAVQALVDWAKAIEDMEVEMEAVPEEDAEQMKKERGIDMPLVQNLQIDRLAIFPNPNEGLFNIRFELPNNGSTAIRVFDARGRLVYTRDLGAFSGDFNDQIDLTANPAGTYFLMVQQDGYSITRKVLVSMP